MAEGARLESACTGNRTGGSNPPLSAQLRQAPAPLQGRGFFMAPAIELVQLNRRRPPDSPNHPTPQEGHWEIGESQIENHEPIWSRYHLHH